MIVYKDKSFIKMSSHPNDNWKGDADWVLDDYNQEELENKIILNYPYFEFVLDENGNIVDVEPYDPPQPPPEPYEPTIEDYMLDMDFRLSCLELGL